MQDYLATRGWESLYHNVQIRDVQVDLLSRSPSGVLTLIEVKGQGVSGLAHLGHWQAVRLSRVCTFLAQWEPIDLQLALVSSTRITLVPVY